MGVVCQACGAENHGGVRVCRLCTAALPDRQNADDASRRRSGAGRSSKATTDSRIPRWWLALGLAAVVGLLFWLWAPAAHEGPTGVAAAAPSAVAEPLKASTAEDGAIDPLRLATAAAEARLQASLERLAREDRERAEAQARQQATTAQPPPRQTESPRRREPQAPGGQPEPAQSASVQVSVNSPTVPPSPAAVSDPLPGGDRPPETMVSVEQRCADSGNFFSRSVCQNQTCANPALASDPVCRRLREAQQARSEHLLN